MVIFNPSHSNPIVIYYNSNIIYVYLPSSFSSTNTFRFNTIFDLSSQPFYLGPYQDKIVYFDIKNYNKNPVSNTLTIGTTTLTLVNRDNLLYRKSTDDEIDLSFNSIKVSVFQSFISNQTLIQDQSFPYLRNYTGVDYSSYIMFTEAIQTPFEFRGINFNNCDFSYSNFNNCLIYDCSFVECNFSNTTLQTADISGSYFLSCDLTGSDWTSGKVNYTNFVICNMERMKFPSTIIHMGHAANYGKIATYPWRLWSGVLSGPQGASIDLLTHVYIQEITQTEEDIQEISEILDNGWYILDQYLNYDSNYILKMNYLGKAMDKVSENETFELGQNYFLDRDHLLDFSGSNLTLSSPLFYSRKNATNQFYYLSEDQIFALDLSLNSSRALISNQGDRIQRFVDGEYVLNGWRGKEYDLSENFMEKDFSNNYVVDASMVNTQSLVNYVITQSDVNLSDTIAKVYYWIDKDTYYYTKPSNTSFLYLRKNNTDLSFNDVDITDSLFSHYFYNDLLYVSYKIHGYRLRHITIDSNNVITPINLELPQLTQSPAYSSITIGTLPSYTYTAVNVSDNKLQTYIRNYSNSSTTNTITILCDTNNNPSTFYLYINNNFVNRINFIASTNVSQFNIQNKLNIGSNTIEIFYKGVNGSKFSILVTNGSTFSASSATVITSWRFGDQLARQVSITPPNYVSIIDFNNILRVWEGSILKQTISCLNLPIFSFNNYWHYFETVDSLNPSNFIMYSTSSGYRIKSTTFNEDVVNDLILSYVVSVISIDNPIDRVYFILGINSNNLILLKFSLVYSDRFSLSQQTLTIPITSTHNPNHLYSIILAVNQNIKILFYQSDISQIKYAEITPNLTFVYPLHTIKTISNVNNLYLYEEGNQTYFRYSISPNLNFTEIIQPELHNTLYLDATYSILDSQHLIKRESNQFTTLNPLQTIVNIGKTGPLIHDYLKSTYFFDLSNTLKKIDIQNNVTTPTLSTNLLTLPIDNDENIQITVSNNLFFSTLIYNEILFAENVIRFSDYYAYDRRDGFTTFSLDGNQMLFVDFNTKLLWFFARNIENEFELQYTLLPNTETRKYLNLDDKINSMRVDWRNLWIYFGLGGMNPNSKGKVVICSWTFTQTEYKLVQVVSSLLDPSGVSFGSAIDISIFGDLIAIGEPNASPSGNFKRGRVNMYRKETNQIVWVNQLRSEEAPVGFIIKLSPTENELATFGVTLNPLENMKLILFRSILLPSARSIALPYVVEDFEFFGKEALMTSNEVVEKNSIFHWIQKVNRCFEIVTTRDLTHDSIVKQLSDRFDIYSIRNQYVLMVRKKLDTNNDYQESSIELYHVEDDLEQLGVIDLENKNIKLFGNISSSYDGSTLGYQSYQDGKFNFYFYF